MIKNLTVRTKSNKEEQIVLKQLQLSDLEQILSLQHLIIEGLHDKTWYADTSKEEFEEILQHTGILLGYINSKSELVAMGVYAAHGYNEHNYGYDLDLEGEDLLKVSQIESTVVHPDYRGNGLQNILCDLIETLAIEKGTPLITATACPDNTYSVNTFIKRGYTIERDKLKYDGLRRYVLMKDCR